MTGVKLSASQAAKQVGKSVPTITRAIKSNKLSAEKLEGGGYLIDPAELFRVFPPVTETPDETPSMLGRETPPETSVLEAELAALRQQIEAADLERDRERRQLSDQIDDLRGRLYKSEAARAALTERLLPAPEKAGKGGFDLLAPFRRRQAS